MHTALLPFVAGKYRLMFFVFCWMLISCRHTDPPLAAGPPATPKALQEEDRSLLEDVRFASKSSRRIDLVESLYHELVKKDTALTALEERLDELPGKRSDSVRSFNTYDGKNNDYYGSAERHISEIKDSILRKKMEAMIAESDTAYKVMTARHRGLLAEVDGQRVSMDDLHEVLKLTRTLPLIQQYQKGHLPGISPLQHLREEYERLVREEARLAKK
jgi:hypothetical protein